VAKRLPTETVATLRQPLERLAPRDPERSRLLADTARLYGISRTTLYAGFGHNWVSLSPKLGSLVTFVDGE
jgi:hypothetical protein